jgi:Fe2+ or Zn2+ uptake regulation protein
MNYEELLNQLTKTNIKINKIKIVLLALWDNQNHPEAQELIKEFRDDMHNLRSGH